MMSRETRIFLIMYFFVLSQHQWSYTDEAPQRIKSRTVDAGGAGAYGRLRTICKGANIDNGGYVMHPFFPKALTLVYQK